jgi:hypothetical protein
MPVEDVGEQQLKNIARPVRVYRVATDRNAETATGPLPLPNKPSIAAMGYSRSGSRNRLSRRVGFRRPEPRIEAEPCRAIGAENRVRNCAVVPELRIASAGHPLTLLSLVGVWTVRR